ncbi:Transposable element P transposase, partial [Aphis craccivora]
KDEVYDDNDTGYEVNYRTERIKIIHLNDSPHLLKGVRNNMLNVVFTINSNVKEACRKDIFDLFEMDSNIQEVKMLPDKATCYSIGNNKK